MLQFKQMLRAHRALVVVGLLAGIAGCKSYASERPPIDQLDSRDKGIQSKDLVDVTDEMTASLLSNIPLNTSRTQWTIVTTNTENDTSKRANYDIFIDRLKTNVFKQSNGRVTLIENKAKYNQLRSEELDTPTDTFGQTGGGVGPNGRIQPDYALNGKVQDMPNRGTNTYRFEFTLTNLKNGTLAWTNDYLVKVAR
jgi:hypothetical protein